MYHRTGSSEMGHPTYLTRSTSAQEISRTDCLLAQEIETIRPLMHPGPLERQGQCNERFLYALLFFSGGPVLCRTERNRQAALSTAWATKVMKQLEVAMRDKGVVDEVEGVEEGNKGPRASYFYQLHQDVVWGETGVSGTVKRSETELSRRDAME